MHGVFTSSLWYLELFAFAVLLIAFFFFILYLANINYVYYNPRFDKRKQIQTAPPHKPRNHPEPKQMPLCLEPSCMWFCRLVGSITTIAVCYYFAYTLVSNTKLKFGIFVP